VKMVSNAQALRITEQGVVALLEDQERLFEADTVILATGVSPVNDLYDALQGEVGQLFLIGDAKEPRRAIDAIREGFEIGMAV